MNGEAGPTPIRRPQPLRRIGFIDIDSFEAGDTPIAFKAYEVVFGEREGEDRSKIFEAARGTARGVAEREMNRTAHHGLGFTIVHHGEDSEWLLVCWWTHECILCQSLLRADRGSADFIPHEGMNVACTWELAVHAHERESWVRHVMRSGEAGWRERYLGDTFAGEF